jgi:t-SNARE complex subunit (syntaxin)
LQQLAAKRQTQDGDAAAGAAGGVTVQIEEPAAEEPEPFMSDFFARVKRIRDNISQIEDTIERVAQLHKDLLVEVIKDKADRINTELRDGMNKISKTANSVRRDLKAMEQENKQAQQTGVYEDGSVDTDLRIRQSQHATRSRKFVKVMTRYNDVQAENKRKYAESVKRQCRVVDPNITDETVEHVIEHGTEGLFTGKRLEDAEAALNEIKDRHKDIQQLEKSLLELHEMFTDMATLVASQGEMIDRIEFSVERSHNYVVQAKKELTIARQYQSKARHKMICCIAIVIIIIIILIAILAK